MCICMSLLFKACNLKERHSFSFIPLHPSKISRVPVQTCAEYSKSLMREAKAHFEGAATLADSHPSPSTSAETTNAASTASEPARPAGSGELHLAARDNFTSNASASQPDDATGNGPSIPPQAGRDADTPVADSRNPRTALAAAHKATKQPGSSTALVLQFREGSNMIKASNLVRLSG